MRWAKQKKQRLEEEARQKQLAADAKGDKMHAISQVACDGLPQAGLVMTSQSLGDLNAMTSMNDPQGGIALQTNHFSNMDIEMGFRKAPEPGSLEDIGIKANTPMNLEPGATMGLQGSGSITLGAGIGLDYSLSLLIRACIVWRIRRRFRDS